MPSLREKEEGEKCHPQTLASLHAQQGGTGAMFDAIAGRYDLLNRLLSLGLDQSWRTKAALALHIVGDGLVLDLATGTADLAIRIAGMYPGASVHGTDPSKEMIAKGLVKVKKKGLESKIKLSQGDAQHIDAAGESYDAVSMAFGIRNVADRELALREMRRVTKPHGRVVILELSEPRDGAMGALSRFYIHKLVPQVGALLSGSKEYRYLQKSIQAFPSAEVFSEQMRGAGLRVLDVTALSFGVAHIYVGEPT